MYKWTVFHCRTAELWC